jgi:CubicO group peptidase (beta-lactamase class C family)
VRTAGRISSFVGKRSFAFAGLALVSILIACSSNHLSQGGGSDVVPAALPMSAGSPAKSPIGIEGVGTDAYLDKLVVNFMVTYHVPNAQLAVSSGGKTIFSHAYTYKGVAASTTTRNTMMRLASNSKAWTDGALYNLIKAGKVNPNAKVFAYLGITKPLPAHSKADPRVYDITIEDMIQHKSGWDDSVPPYYDPTFNMRSIALALGLKRAVNAEEYVQYQLHEPLQEAPGTTYAYCNFCYTVLGMVIAKASGMTYGEYLAGKVGKPLKIDNVKLSPTIGKRLKDEVAKYYSSASPGLSAIYVTSNKPWPQPYSGDGMILEIAGGASAVATNADSMLAFMNKYLIWGVGTPEPQADWAREGSMPGTNTWAEQLPNGKNFSFLVNTRSYVYAGSQPTVFEDLQQQFEQHLDPGLAPQQRRVFFER